MTIFKNSKEIDDEDETVKKVLIVHTQRGK